MDFKSILSQLDQLNEAEGTTVHKGTYGTSHGKEDVRDQYGHKIGKVNKDAETKKEAPKKSRGRPKKGADETGEVKSYDFSAFGVNKGKDVKLPKHDKKKTVKHSLKEYLDQLDKALNEDEQIQIKPASQMPKKTGQTSVPGQPQQVQGQAQQNTQVIAQGDKTLGTVNNLQLANQIKQSIGKGEMTLTPDGQMDEDFGAVSGAVAGAALGTALGAVKGRYDDMKFREKGHTAYTPDDQKDKERTAMQRLRAAAGFPSKNDPNVKIDEKDIGKHNNATTGFAALAKKTNPKIAGAQLARMRDKGQVEEADQPPRDALASPLTLEAKNPKPDKNKNKIPDYAEDGKGKNDLKKVKEDMDSESKTDKKKCPPMSHIKKMCQDGKSVAEICKMHPDCDQKELKQMVADCKKKMVKEGMEHKLKSARHAGKSHALARESYNCKYDDMEEARHYHEGFKEGLDECYGQMPIQGYVGEANPPATVPGMASQAMREPAMEDDMYEVDKTTYMKQQAMKDPGDTFNAFGQTFKDKDVLESPFAFEALEKQLNALLEDKEVTEGMTVSISKGQQGAPDSVSVSAQDGEADQLLSIIKSAGLGLFGGDDAGGYGAPQGGQPQHGGLDVVGDHDGMMALIKKVSGGEAGNGDYADEEGHADEHGHEGTCESCGGMMEAGHSCDEGQEMVDEVQSVAQMTYQMAEDNPPDSGADNTDAAIADTAQANAAGAAYNPRNDVDEGAGGPEASEEPVEKLTPDQDNDIDPPGQESDPIPDDQESDSIPDDQESDSIPDDDESDEEKNKADKESMSESMFVNLYKKLILISEESTSEKDDKAEKAAKKVAKDIEYDEDHKGKDDDKAEEAGKKVKKDIEYDDKKDKKKIDEWANDAGPGKSASDTAFETDIDFMMNVISGGLNKRKVTGQTTIPVIAGQNRTTSRNTTDINESVEYSNDAVAQWKKLAGLK